MMDLIEFFLVNGAIVVVLVVCSILYYRWAEDRKNRQR